MDAPQPFSDREIAFLEALVAESVWFLLVDFAVTPSVLTKVGAERYLNEKSHRP